MTAPINWIRQWLHDQSLRAVVGRAELRRNTMAGAHELDVVMNTELNTKRNHNDRRDLLMIQSGACWTAHGLWRAGYLEKGTCPWCGVHEETLKHLWWECPAHAHLRTSLKHKLTEQGITLPVCLELHGIPPEPSADMLGPMWPSAVTEQQPQDVAPLAGDDMVAWAECTEWLQGELRGAGHDDKIERLSVRQAACWFHGDYGELPGWNMDSLPFASGAGTAVAACCESCCKPCG